MTALVLYAFARERQKPNLKRAIVLSHAGWRDLSVFARARRKTSLEWAEAEALFLDVADGISDPELRAEAELACRWLIAAGQHHPRSYPLLTGRVALRVEDGPPAVATWPLPAPERILAPPQTTAHVPSLARTQVGITGAAAGAIGVIGRRDGIAHVWDLDTRALLGEIVVVPDRPLEARVERIAIDPGRGLVALSMGNGATVGVWSFDGRARWRHEEPAANPVDLVFDDGRLELRRMSRWIIVDPVTGAKVGERPYEGPPPPPSTEGFDTSALPDAISMFLRDFHGAWGWSRDGQTQVLARDEWVVVKRGDSVRGLVLGHATDRGAPMLAIADDGSQLALARGPTEVMALSADPTIQWKADAPSGPSCQELQLLSDAGVVLHRGRRCVSVFDAHTGALRQVLSGHPGATRPVLAMHRHSRSIFTFGQDATIREFAIL